ncbi:DUF4222 domain-containing protein [Pantoea ananatis]|uniref:DUF4222 domain-containing protein n=1 Tax=Pantoea ananas TaxID=553 RepID=UPI0030C8A1FF
MTGPLVDERYVNTNKRFRNKRGIVVRVISYDRKERQIIFMYDDYEHECIVSREHFDKFFNEVKE